MFDLEKSIADWRKQMLAAGIKTPVPMEELEIHLREEIERQMQLDANEQSAFETAVARIGQGIALKTEFTKTKGLFGFANEDKLIIIYRILGVFWFTQFTGLFTFLLIRILLSPVARAIISNFPHYWQFFTVFCVLWFSASILGSILLFCGAKLGISIIRIIATLGFLLCLFECVTQDKSFGDPNYRFGVFAIINLITIGLLHLPRHTKRNPVAAVK
jgi:hypothetical protein